LSDIKHVSSNKVLTTSLIIILSF